MSHSLSEIDTSVKGLKAPIAQLPAPVQKAEEHLTRLDANLEELRKSVDRTSQMILTAIYLVGFIVCVGTPLMGILVFKFRRQILEAFKQEPNYADEKVIELVSKVQPRRTYTSMKPINAAQYRATHSK